MGLLFCYIYPALPGEVETEPDNKSKKVTRDGNLVVGKTVILVSFHIAWMNYIPQDLSLL